jgi:hypothetical protein
MSVPLGEHPCLYSLSTIFNLEFLFAVSAVGLYGMLHPFVNFGSHYKKNIDSILLSWHPSVLYI